MPRHEQDISAARFPIRIAARRAGVSVPALRAWERRYGAVAPVRTAGEQRLYSEDDVERIALLRQLTEAGHSISAIAPATNDELRQLVASSVPWVDPAATASTSIEERAARVPAAEQPVIRAGMRAVRSHDAEAVYRLLQRETFRLTTLAFVEEVATPFMQRIGDEWAAGRLTEAQERVGSGALRRVLGVLLQYLRIDERDREPSAPAPRVVVTTLAGERHENGALMAAAVAADVDCDVDYAGADLPAAAVATAARQARADIVALSLLDGSAPRLAQRELRELRDRLPARTRIIVGGASAALLDDVLEPLGARRVESLAEWRQLLLQRIASSARRGRHA